MLQSYKLQTLGIVLRDRKRSALSHFIYPDTVAKAKLMDWYHQAWRLELSSKSKLEMYSQIKEKLAVEPYIKNNICKANRALICQLRTGCLKLFVETGRYVGLPRTERICKLCNLDVETEIHFIFHCNSYHEGRVKLHHQVPEVLNFQTPVEKLKYLCT